jgi:arabinose-5-phosphate isomerase
VDPQRLKLFHFGRFDIAVLLHRFGVLTAPVYCTKIASRLVRTYTDRHGLKYLLQELLDIDISKQQQSSDWGADRLTQAQLDYAASDVLYLHRLRAALDAMLEREGRIALAKGMLRLSSAPGRAGCGGLGGTGHLLAFLRAPRLGRRAIIVGSRTARRQRAQGRLDRGAGARTTGGVARQGVRRCDQCHAAGARARHRLRNGQVGARRPQDRRDACFDRNACAVRAPRRSKPWRSRHDRRRGCCLLLSNSGETPELADLIAYTRRFSIPLIGVAGNAESTLIRQADIGIVLPPADEACPMGLAPTSSTTMTLALGDAFAVALMEHRQFTPEDFRGFHPGGRLGARLAKVENLMHGGEAVPIVRPDTRMSEALLEMTQKGFGVVGVVDEGGELVGIITDGDLRRNMEGLLSKRARDVMTTNPRTIATDALASEALGIMNDRKITTLFVTERAEPRRPVGILHVHDCLRAGVG